MLSVDGRSKVMDEAADGYVRSETCRALWLHAAPGGGGSGTAPTSTILAFLSSTAVNTNGQASSLTAPHGPSQQALLADALVAAGLVPGSVAGLQLHANGTPLGD